jgi:single-strand DNA-binding protein
MFDTYVTIVGNVLHEPEMRKTTNTGAIVTTFRIASTARRLDRQSGKWIDGNSLRVRVTCWRALAANVTQSVRVGDPLVVHGRLFTRDWEDEQGARRTAYELEAVAVGHDLSRGRAVFERAKPKTSTSAVEDAEADQRVGGEPTELVPDDEAPAQFDDTPFEVLLDQPAAAVGEGHLDGSGPAVGPDASPPAGDDATGTGGEPAERGGGRRGGSRRVRVPA